MALVLTLAFIVIFSLILLALFFQLSNNTKQIKSTEESIEAMHIARMGNNYYIQLIHHELEMLEPFDANQFLSNIKTETERVEIEGENKYFSITSTPIIDEEDDRTTITVNFVSTGTAYEKEVDIDNHFTVEIIHPEDEETATED